MALLVMWGCSDETPTSGNENLIPVEAETYEVQIPFSEFVTDFQVHGGFSTAANLPQPLVAHEYREDLDAHALIGFARLPQQIQVLPPGETTTRPDSLYVPTGGTLILRMDTIQHPEGAPIEVALRSVQERWHTASASWTHAVDTLGDRTEWSAPGAADSREVGVVSWNPLDGDSVVFELDSLTATEWSDRGSQTRSASVESRTPGTLMSLRSATFRPEIRSDINPDTVITLSAATERRTVIYSPQPGVTTSEIRVGGAPARRAYIRMAPPSRVEEGSAQCADVPCPLDITPGRLVYAGLVLRTVPTSPSAFQPRTSFRLGARPALAFDRIPRSPLGPSIQPDFRVIGSNAFGPDGQTSVEIPMTRYMQDILRDLAEGTELVPTTVTLFAATEPSGLQYATFQGPGQEGEPYLRLILTLSEGVKLP